MKTLLYEIRYYLIVAVLVIWLVPDHENHKFILQPSKDDRPISTIHKNPIKNPVYLKYGSDWKSDIELQTMLEEEVKKDVEDGINDLFPEPNRY